MEIELYKRPGEPVAEEILSIVEELTGAFFTEDVAPATRLDLTFQDVLCARAEGRIRSFLMFTGLDGAIHITLMGTSSSYRRQGLGSALLKRLELHATKLGYDELVTFTVPPTAKPAYQSTVDFYQKHGFVVVKRYTELWQIGAWELRKSLPAGG